MFEGDDKPYRMWKNGEHILGGLAPLAEEAKEMGAPPHWMGYIATDDLDATLSKAQELGAKVLVPATDIPEVCRFASLQDPQGAAFGTYEFAQSDEPRDRGIGDCGPRATPTSNGADSLTALVWPDARRVQRAPLNNGCRGPNCSR